MRDERKHQGRQRACRLFPRLGFPLWNPSSEAPPLQGMAKGGNPSPLRRERQICSRLRGPWGSGANPPWFALWVTAFAVFHFLPGRRPHDMAAALPPVSRYGGSRGKGQGEALDFRARKNRER